MRVTNLIKCENKHVGLTGVIDEPRHQFDSWWVCSYLRTTGEHNLTTELGQYMIWIADKPLHVSAREDRARYLWVTFDSASPCLCGYGVAAASIKWVREKYDSVMATRRQCRAD
jgi:hypothetical protein